MVVELKNSVLRLDYLMNWQQHPSMHPRFGDVMIRSLVGATATSFIVTDALTLRFLSGPYGSMSEAISAAHAAASSQRSSIWQENQDELGREIGPPIHVDSSNAQVHA